MPVDVIHPTMQQLEAGLDMIRRSPTGEGVLAMIVCRPAVDRRKVLDAGDLSLVEGLVGDRWRARGPRTGGTAAGRDNQLTVMNARAIALVAQTKDRWPLAGDQLYVDLDLSASNLPPGARLAVGQAVIEITAVPHTGCKKFAARFGHDALRFVNGPVGRALNLRGVNAKVVRGGAIRVGDAASRL